MRGVLATKAAMVNLGKGSRGGVRPAGVRVNTISPGPVLTDVWTSPGSTGEAAVTGQSTGQITQPAEVAALVVFLISDAARNLNGSDVVIDGGVLKTC